MISPMAPNFVFFLPDLGFQCLSRFRDLSSEYLGFLGSNCVAMI